MKICLVCLYFISLLFKKNVVWLEICRVCCILCVIIIIEYLFFNFVINFFIFVFEIGFSVEVGLFSRRMVGFIVSVFVIYKCCCWLFDNESVDECK